MFMNMKKLWTENRNKGFTLMETILVVAIIAILLGIGAVGVAQYMDNADELERMGAAQTLYMSLQNHLIEEQKAGRLDAFNAMVNAGDTYTLFDYTSSVSENTAEKAILAANGQPFDETFANKHNGTKIVAVFYDGENKTQAKYKNIYNLFVTLGVDTGILDNQFVFEYNQTTGIVQSVFFTKEPGVKFASNSYNTGVSSSKNNVLARSGQAIDDKKQGYYGLFETSALSEKVKVILESKVVLVNDDRIYLTFRSETPHADKNLNTFIQLRLKDGTPIGDRYHVHKTTAIPLNTDISTILDSLDSHTIGDVGKNKQIEARHINMGDGTAIYFVVLSCGEHDLFFDPTVKSILGEHPEKAEIYVSFEDGTNLKSNTINPYFESVTTENGEDVYSISCSRHLANLNKVKEINNTLDWKSLHYRVVGDIDLMQYEREENHLPEVLSKVIGIGENEILANSKLGSEGLSKIQEDATPWNLQRHFKGGVAPVVFGETIDDMKYFDGIFEGLVKADGTKTSIFGVTVIAESTKMNGFFKQNKGVIQNLAFKKSAVYSGFCAGIVCGRNRGTIQNVDVEEFVVAHELDSLKNKGHESKIALNDERTAADDSHKVGSDGLLQRAQVNASYDGSMVGGICGITYQSISNCTATRGVVYGEESYGGGIVGWAFDDNGKNDNFEIANCTVTDCFVSVTARSGGIVGHCEFKIENCKVLKEDESKLTPIGLKFRPSYDKYTAVNKDDVRTRITRDMYPSIVANRNSCRAGGIAGTANNNIVNCENHLDVYQSFEWEQSVAPGSSSLQNVGGIVGLLGFSKGITDDYSISNCTNYGAVISEHEGFAIKFIGGIAGMSYLPIENCVNYGDVTGNNTECVGGIAGGTLNDIKNCKVLTNPDTSDQTLYIRGRKYVGGIAGIANSGVIENCYVACEKDASGNVAKVGKDIIITHPEYYTANYNLESIGGICGICSPGDLTEFKVSSSANYGTISAKSQINTMQYCGGIIGRCYYSTQVDKCENGGNILTDKNNGDMKFCGGIVGWQNNDWGSYIHISDSINKGDLSHLAVDGKTLQYCGGILGMDSSNTSVLEITDCSNYGSMFTTGKLENCGGIFVHATSSQSHKFQNLYNYGTLQSTTSMSTVGGITAKLIPSFYGSLFDDIHNEGDIIAGTSCSTVGGIVGTQDQWKEITNASNAGNITAGTSLNKVGGILGENTGYVTINVAENKESARFSSGTTMNNTGGIIGYSGANSWGNNLTSVSNAGSFLSNSTMTGVGGIAGNLEGSSSNNLNLVSNTGAIAGIGNVTKTGGIIGIAQKALLLNGKADATTNTGSITTSGTMSDVGGIAGYLSGYSNVLTTVTNTGTISTTGAGTMSKTGGIVGEVTQSLTLTGETAKTTNEGTITASAAMSQVGGIAGYLPGNSGNTLTSVTNSGAISTTGTGNMSKTGGIVGEVTQSLTLAGEATKTTNEGAITASAAMSQVGGIAGQIGMTFSTSLLKNSGEIKGVGQLQEVGGIIGKQINGGTYTGFENTGNITSGDNRFVSVGGILGASYGQTITITTSKNEGIMLAKKGESQAVGGILGYSGKNGDIAGNKIDINHCDNNGSITVYRSNGGNTGVGGIVGCSDMNQFSFDTCNNNADIVVQDNANTSYHIGGIVGRIVKGNWENPINNCKNFGSITVAYNAEKVGGILGSYNLDTIPMKIMNCENGKDAADDSRGKISINGTAKFLGGIVGYSKGITVDSCKNYEYISSSNNMTSCAGILGRNETGKVEIKNSNNYGKISSDKSLSEVAGILGRSEKCSATIISKSENHGVIETKEAMTGVAGVVGYISGGTNNNISDVKNKGDITSKSGNSYRVGGIIGYDGEYTIKDSAGKDVSVYAAISLSSSQNDGNITVSRTESNGVGGIVGGSNMSKFTYKSNTNNGKISTTENSSSSTVKTKKYIGGIVGYIGKSTTDSEITDSGNDGELNISYNAEGIGGIIGYIGTSTSFTIKNCSNYKGIAIAGNATNTGGTIGYMKGGIVENAINSGSLTVDGNMTNVGGLIGKNENNAISISKPANNGSLYAKGDMTYVAGLVGYSNVSVDINNNIWDISFAAQNNGSITSDGNMKCVAGLVGYTKGVTIKYGTNTKPITASGNMTYVAGGVGQNETNALKLLAVTNNEYIHAGGTMTGTGGICGYINSVGEIGDENNGYGQHETKNLGNISSEKQMTGVGGIVGQAASGDQMYLRLVNEGDIISAQGKLDGVGGLVGTYNTKNKTNVLLISRSKGTIQGYEMNNVGGLVGRYYGASGQRYINGKRLEYDGDYDSTDYQELEINISSVGVTSKMTNVGAVIGYDGDTFVPIRNYKFVGSISSDNSSYTTFYLIGNKKDYDASTYHCAMEAKILFSFASGEGYSWEEERVLVAGDAEFKSTEAKTVTLTVTAENKMVDTIKLGTEDLTVPTYTLEGTEKKYLVEIPSGKKAGVVTVTLKDVPADVVFTLPTGEGYKWENDITNIQVPGTDDGKTAEDKTVNLIVTNTSKKLDEVKLGDTTLSSSLSETLGDGSKKYTVTIPANSATGDITVSLAVIRKVTINMSDEVKGKITITALKSDGSSLGSYNSDDLADEVAKFKVELANSADPDSYTVNGTKIDSSNSSTTISFADGETSLTITVEKDEPDLSTPKRTVEINRNGLDSAILVKALDSSDNEVSLNESDLDESIVKFSISIASGADTETYKVNDQEISNSATPSVMINYEVGLVINITKVEPEKSDDEGGEGK